MYSLTLCFSLELQRVTRVTPHFQIYIYIYFYILFFARVTRYNLPKNHAKWALRVVLHAFAWPLHLPNIDVTTKFSKNSECK